MRAQSMNLVTRSITLTRFMVQVVVLSALPSFAQNKSVESAIPPQFAFPTANYTKLVRFVRKLRKRFRFAN
jgi:hypothetical protein